MSRRALATAALALLVLGGMAAEVDLDVWHLMALARETVRGGWVPYADRFAFTPTVYPSVQHEWGTGMLLYGVVQAGGAPALLALRAALVLVVCALAWRLAVRRGAGEGVLVLLAPTAVVMSWIGWTLLRPQVFTLLFLAVLLGCLDSDRRGGRGWMGPWLAGWVLWLNLHGGAVVGLAAVGLEAVERAVRGERPWHLGAVLLAMLLLMGVNPYGWHYYTYLWHALSMDRRLIGEWQPLTAAEPVAVATVALALLIAVYAVLKVGPRCAAGWPLLAVAAYEAVRHERHVSLFALVWFVQVPALVSATRLGAMFERLYARAGLPVALALLVVGSVLVVRQPPWHARIAGTGKAAYAVGPVDRLAELGFRGEVVVPFDTGAYVLWKLTPAVRVSIDSRYEVAYPPGALEEHLDFYHAAPRWRDVLRAMPAADLVLAERAAPVRERLERDAGWSTVYEDDAWVLLARPGVTLPYLDRRGERIEGRLP